jgi:hypothetical protein
MYLARGRRISFQQGASANLSAVWLRWDLIGGLQHHFACDEQSATRAQLCDHKWLPAMLGSNPCVKLREKAKFPAGQCLEAGINKLTVGVALAVAINRAGEEETRKSWHGGAYKFRG